MMKVAEWFMIQILKKNRLWMRGLDHIYLMGTLSPMKEEHAVRVRKSLLPWWCERWRWEDSCSRDAAQSLLLLLLPSAAFVSFQKKLSRLQASVTAAGRPVTPIFCCSSVSSCYNRIPEAIKYKPYRWG